MKWLMFLLSLVLAAVSGRAGAEGTGAFTSPYGVSIGNLPSPVVGDTSGTEQLLPYLYPDAFDLSNYTLTDTTATLSWSYEVVGSSKYLINGVPPIDSAIIDPRTPGAGHAINQTVANGEANPDGKAATITVRNQRLYPLGGSPSQSPGYTGIGDIQPVTFWLSDGTNTSRKSILFYTKVGGSNYLSQKTVWKTVNQFTFPAWDHSWKFAEGPLGNMTTSTFGTTGGGLCLSVTASGDNYGSIAQQAPNITLTANTAYRLRLRMNSSQWMLGTVPFWDFIIENYPARGQVSLNLYAMDAFFLDNENSANAIHNSQDGTWVSLYWTPPPVQATGTNWMKLFTDPQYSSRKDARVRFRVMDLDSGPLGGLSYKQFGQICMQEMVIESIPFNVLTSTGTDLVNLGSGSGQTKFIAANTTGTGNIQCDSFFSDPAVFNTDGSVTIAPQGLGIKNEIMEIIPATKADRYLYAPDKWPIPWHSAELLEYTATIKAPTKADADSPWDLMWLNMEAPTNEVNCENTITANKGLGSPTTTPSTYTMLFWTQNKTNTLTPQFVAMRWRLRFGNGRTMQFPDGQTTNTGAATVTGIKVRKLNVPY